MVRVYQRAAEGRPSPCRFSPTCSAYAIEALQVHGTLRGLMLTLRRLVRCRPFGPSGWDPVPPACEDHVHHTHRHRRFRQKGYAA
jgi:putative membrane protein insertion efficiency factor